MTASPFVTACPACGTRFRVNAAHLNAAGGHVRCGACLEVFVARDVVEAASPADQDALIEAAAVETLRADATTPAEVGLPLAETASPGAQRALTSTTPEDEAAQVVVAPAVDSATAHGHAPSSSAVESPGRHRFMVLELPRDHAAAPIDPATRRRAVLDGELEPGLSSSQREQFDHLAPDPLEALPTPQTKRWRWLALLGGVLLLLVAQVLYFQVDRWSSVPAIRPVYTGLCYVLGCTVPLYRDAKAMRSENVVVRPHPERGDVLLIDAQVINKAPYPQAFPLLQIDLLDRSGQIISSRVFEADDYRTGELATMPDVPPNRPLQISVEVYRPREDVASYHFQLLPPGGRS